MTAKTTRYLFFKDMPIDLIAAAKAKGAKMVPRQSLKHIVITCLQEFVKKPD